MSDIQPPQQEQLVSDCQYPIFKGQKLINSYIYNIRATNQEILRIAKNNGIKLDTPMQVFQFYLTNHFAKKSDGKKISK